MGLMIPRFRALVLVALLATPTGLFAQSAQAGRDSSAASVLAYGLSQQMSLTDCARVGGIAAAEIISHFGARPEVPLRTLVQKNLKRA